MTRPLNTLTIGTAREELDRRACSSAELVGACLQQISSLDGSLHAMLETFVDDAKKDAESSDKRHANGEVRGVLDGIPIVLKDNMLVQGHVASAGSKILAKHVAASNSTIVEKLKAQGAIIIGRANMDEFAMGSSTEHSAYGPTKHPRDPDRVPGGSSGGSAVSVAADYCLASLGSDTGGSIRQPAALCGVIGLKPTYGRVSRSGLIAMASSLDQIGPFAKSSEDAAYLFSAIAGVDPKDQTTANVSAFQPAWRERLDGLRVGLPRQAWGEGMSDGVRMSVTTAVRALKDLGATIVDVDLPYADEALAVYYVLMPCEVSTNLSRFDGMRYGLRAENLPLFETYARSRAEGFGTEARRRILLGTFALSRGYYDAYYLQAKKVQNLIRRGYEDVFRNVDVLVTPTAPTTAFKLGEKINDPLAMYLEDIFTVGSNVAGLPAVSIPVDESEGLPVGMQIIGKHFDEATILAVARAYEER